MSKNFRPNCIIPLLRHVFDFLDHLGHLDRQFVRVGLLDDLVVPLGGPVVHVVALVVLQLLKLLVTKS